MTHVDRGRELTQTAVRFESGETAYLDGGDFRSGAWAKVLSSQREIGAPVYVEIAPQTSVITELLLPLAVMVGSIAPARDGDGVEVSLVISHAVHFLRRSNPNYVRLLDTLESARKSGTRILVTETADSHEIIDVRPGMANRLARERSVTRGGRT